MAPNQSRPLPRSRATVLTVLFLAGCGADGVQPSVPSSIEVSPATVSLVSIGETATLQAKVRKADGGELPATGISWSTNDASIATVGSDGVVTAVRDGRAEITARLAALAGTAAVLVEQRGVTLTVEDSVRLSAIDDTVGLVATVVDARGQALAGATVEWTSSDPGIMAIVSGVRVTAFQDGAVTLTARSGALAARSTGLVRQQVAALRWLTTPTDLLEGEAPAEIKIEVRDRRGHPVVNATEPVTVRLSGGPGLLTGPSQQIPVRGVADFAATTISAAGINYRLTAASDGVPSVTTAFFPVQHRFAVLWVGWTMNCARDLAGLTWCWGQNYRSLLLIPGDLDVFQPTRSPALDAFPVLHTSGFPCATSAAGLFCWGSVASPPLSQPQLIATGSSITGISTGNQGCGSRASVMVCWGAFGPGQSISPIAIPGPPQLQIVTTGVGLAPLLRPDAERSGLLRRKQSQWRDRKRDDTVQPRIDRGGRRDRLRRDRWRPRTYLRARSAARDLLLGKQPAGATGRLHPGAAVHDPSAGGHADAPHNTVGGPGSRLRTRRRSTGLLLGARVERRTGDRARSLSGLSGPAGPPAGSGEVGRGRVVPLVHAHLPTAPRRSGSRRRVAPSRLVLSRSPPNRLSGEGRCRRTCARAGPRSGDVEIDQHVPYRHW